MRTPIPVTFPGRVAVFAPCKGVDLGLADNLRPLFEQDHTDYELVFVVESVGDPACAVIRELMRAHPYVAARLVVSGKASRSGQKVHSLRWATADLAPQIRYLAFVDSDARPGRDWLRLLTQRLYRDESGAATGYRWFVAARPTFVNRLLCCINASVATMYGSGKFQLLWGGSWAIRRDTFDRLEIREAWRGKLNDDLVATRALQRAGLHIEFEPNCVVTSPIDLNFGELLAFIRRQYVQGRCHVRHWWSLSLVGMVASMITFWGTIAASLLGAATAAWWTWIPAAAAGTLGAWGVWRAWMRRDIARIYFGRRARRGELATAARMDLWAWPLAGIVHAMGVIASAWGSRIKWRGIQYRLTWDGQIVGIQRPAISSDEAEQRMLQPERQRTPVREAPTRSSSRPEQPVVSV